MASRLEAAGIAAIMVVLLVGGRAWAYNVAQFREVSVLVLAVIGIVILAAFRRNYRAGGPLARLHAARDGAFLAAITTAIAFVVAPARWSVGATIVAVELGLLVELLARCIPAPP